MDEGFGFLRFWHWGSSHLQLHHLNIQTSVGEPVLFWSAPAPALGVYMAFGII